MPDTSSGAGTDTPGPLEAARGGTLFLDEVGDLPRDLQGTVLRLLTGEGIGILAVCGLIMCAVSRQH